MAEGNNDIIGIKDNSQFVLLIILSLVPELILRP